jgi:hypothetical protein
VQIGGPGGEIYHFNANGRACDSTDTGFSPSPWERGGIPGTYEGGPWELEVEEGTAEFKSQQELDWEQHTKS